MIPEFTPQQQKIFDGLLAIGPQIAHFYADGVALVQKPSEFNSTTNLLAHLAREIDGGLRDLLAPKVNIEKEEGTSVEAAAELATDAAGENQHERSHFESILLALGEAPGSKLASEWFAVAKHFHKFSHRSGIYKPSKPADEIIALWAKFEDVLTSLTASFYSITDRLNTIMQNDKPSKVALGTLNNMLISEKYSQYFFQNLTKETWLPYLRHQGYFTLARAPTQIAFNGYPARWHAIHYLKRMSQSTDKSIQKQIGKIINKLISECLVQDTVMFYPSTLVDIAEIMANLSDFPFTQKHSEFFALLGKRNANSWVLFQDTLSQKIPSKIIGAGDIDSAKTFLDYFFGFAIVEGDDIDFEGTLWKSSPQIIPVVQEHLYNDLTTEYSKGFAHLLGKPSFDIVKKKIEEIVLVSSSDLSGVSYPSIEQTGQSQFLHHWQHDLVEFLIAVAVEFPVHVLKTCVQELLSSKHSIFQRIAFHLIRIRFDELKEIFWEYVKDSSGVRQLYIHEPYMLLNEHSGNFTEDETIKIIQWLEKEYTEDTPSEHFHVLRWLSALHPSTLRAKNELREKKIFHESFYSWPIEHPEFDSYSTSHFGFTKPLQDAEFEQLTVSDQVSFVEKFVNDPENDVTEEGLSVQLTDAVKNNPFKYLFSLDQWLLLKPIFIQALLEGLLPLAKTKEVSDPFLIIDFLEKINYDVLSAESSPYRIDYRRELVIQSARIVSALANQGEQLGMEQVDAERLQDFLLGLLAQPENQETLATISNDDYGSFILNSLAGRLLEALKDIVLLWGRVAGKLFTVKWPLATKNFFTEYLSSKDPILKDVYIFIGYHFPLFVDWDKQWVNECVLPKWIKASDEIKDYLLGSFFLGHYKPWKPVYLLLKHSGLFEDAVKKYQVDSRPLQTICKYALFEWQFWSLEPDNPASLLYYILNQGIPEQLECIISEAYSRSPLDNDKTAKLWKLILHLKEIDPEKYRNVLVQSSILIEEFTIISDEMLELLLESIASFQDNESTAYTLARHLMDATDDNLANAGKGFYAIIERAKISPGSSDETIKFVSRLYKVGEKHTANRICEFIGNTFGSTILKTLFKANNQLK